MPRKPLRAIETAIGLERRSFPAELGAESPQFCFRIAAPLVPDLIGGLVALDVRGMWRTTAEEWLLIHDAVNECIMSLHECHPCWGADFLATDEWALETLQGEGLPPPRWEFRVEWVDGEPQLQFRHAHEEGEG